MPKGDREGRTKNTHTPQTTQIYISHTHQHTHTYPRRENQVNNGRPKFNHINYAWYASKVSDTHQADHPSLELTPA